MNITTRALHLAEEALKKTISGCEAMGWTTIEQEKALAAIREVLAQPVKTYEQGYLDGYDAGLIFANSRVEPVKQGPVAFALSHSLGLEFSSNYPMCESKERAEEFARQHMGQVVVTPLYVAPVRTKDLTDDEVMDLAMNEGAMEFDCEKISFARAVIAAFKEKNK